MVVDCGSTLYALEAESSSKELRLLGTLTLPGKQVSVAALRLGMWRGWWGTAALLLLPRSVSGTSVLSLALWKKWRVRHAASTPSFLHTLFLCKSPMYACR